MARLTLPANEDMSVAQREVCDEVVSGQRGKIPSPMKAWIHSPELARRAQVLGEFLRFDVALTTAEVEVAILVCARFWTSHQVWTSHKRLALKAGVQPHVIEDIAAFGEPEFPDKRLRMVHRLARELLETKRISETDYAAAVTELGEAAVVELVAIVGYYGLVSLTANAFELGVPENIASELNDPALADSPLR